MAIIKNMYKKLKVHFPSLWIECLSKTLFGVAYLLMVSPSSKWASHWFAVVIPSISDIGGLNHSLDCTLANLVVPGK